MAVRGEHRTLLVVHGHRDGNAIAGGPDISEECVARVRVAESAAVTHACAAVLFCGAGAHGHPSEAVQMASIWRGPPINLLLDELSTDSLENAEQAAAWAHALGVRALVVVSSWWHLRLRLYYCGAAFRGWSVRHVRTRRCHRAAHHLWHELRYLPRVSLRRPTLSPWSPDVARRAT